MATVRNYYLQFGAEAVQALATDLSSNIGAVDGSTLDFAWIPGGAPHGGNFQMTYNTHGTPNPTTVNAYCSEWNSEVVIPIRMAVQFAAWVRNLVFNFGHNGFITLTDIMEPLLTARVSCIADIANCSFSTSSFFSTTFAGNPDPFIVWQATHFYSETDCAVDICSGMNQAMYSSLSSSTGAYTPQVNGGILIVQNAVQPVSDTSPLDLDVSVNNAANIYSVVSRTFTEPGSP